MGSVHCLFPAISLWLASFLKVGFASNSVLRDNLRLYRKRADILWRQAGFGQKRSFDLPPEATFQHSRIAMEYRMSFSSLPLHDALLAFVYISWEAARCDLRLHPVSLPTHLLVFEGFTHIELPRGESWGPSASINTLAQLPEGVFEIELQSGDVIRIKAPHWSFFPESE